MSFLTHTTKFGKIFNNRTKYKLSGTIPSPRERCTLTKINEDLLVMFGGYECSEDETVEINY